MQYQGGVFSNQSPNDIVEYFLRDCNSSSLNLSSSPDYKTCTVGIFLGNESGYSNEPLRVALGQAWSQHSKNVPNQNIELIEFTSK